MSHPVRRISATNFRSLGRVDVELAPFSVLIGPNGSGKTNLLNVLRFLATTVRFDLVAALEEWRGFERVQRQAGKPGQVKLTIEGVITSNASPTAPDRYTLTLSRRGNSVTRREDFTFKRRDGRGRRITVSGDDLAVVDEGVEQESLSRRLATRQTTGLATLPRLADEDGGLGIRQFTELLATLRVIEPDVDAARLPARSMGGTLSPDASNLADALVGLRSRDPDAFEVLKRDLAACLPGLQDVLITPVGGPARSVVVHLVEAGLKEPTELADASFGTVRLLSLLTALHEPDPPRFTAIEEVDHGLHPYALDVLVDRMRSAAQRTQILAATHSPTLVNRLRPEEIIVCDRDPDTGESIIPAISPEKIKAGIATSGARAGELWFAGAIHGVPA